MMLSDLSPLDNDLVICYVGSGMNLGPSRHLTLRLERPNMVHFNILAVNDGPLIVVETRT